MLKAFFTEMWPVLLSSCKILSEYIAGEAGKRLPGKSFSVSSPAQLSGGALTHNFRIPLYESYSSTSGPIRWLHSRRMVVPYQVWMLTRLQRNIEALKQNEQV